MIIKSLEYSQFVRKPTEWKLEGCTLGDINLIVGQNATGKSKTINLIYSLAQLLSGEQKLHFRSGRYKVAFDNDGTELVYKLRYEKSAVTRESLYIDSKRYLNRGAHGTGTIRYEQLDGHPEGGVRFQTPQTELACVARRDNIQHPFLEPLHNWATSVRYYPFGGTMGKEVLHMLPKGSHKPDIAPNPKDVNQVIVLFREGMAQLSTEFTDSIIKDMAQIGYQLENIGTAPPKSIVVRTNIPGQVIGLYVRESDLRANTDQNDMSQGMFRALSLLVHLNYSLLTALPSCILVDDIGEGLDYDRSSALVRLLIARLRPITGGNSIWPYPIPFCQLSQSL